MDYILIYCYFYGLLNLVRNKKKFFIPLLLHSSQHRKGERERGFIEPFSLFKASEEQQQHNFSLKFKYFFFSGDFNVALLIKFLRWKNF